MDHVRPPRRRIAQALALGAMLAVSGCGALKAVRDEVVGVKPALQRCLDNRDHVTPIWLPIPHLACRGGTPRVPGRERQERTTWSPG